MKRTMSRPVPRGAITPNRALAFAMVLGVVSFLLLNYLVNPLAAWLSLGGNAYYVFVYTMWLKRTTPQNIVIGGAAGSIPPLVGWAAVTGTLGWPAIALAVLIFLWTPPHFWALSLMTELDYDKAGIPMMPNVHGEARTKREMLIYTIVLFVFCIALVPLHVFGPDLPRRRDHRRRLVSLRCDQRAAQRFATARARHVQVFADVSRADVPGRRDRPRGVRVTRSPCVP